VKRDGKIRRWGDGERVLWFVYLKDEVKLKCTTAYYF
jgi:hypothetical protein